MKKLLFTLLSAMALFSSCSSDNDTLIESGIDNNPIEKKYTVNFDIKSDGFEVDKAPMRSTQSYTNQASFMQVIVYNEAGTVYSDTIIEQSKLGIQDNIISITMEIPEGNYYLSVFNRIYNSLYLKLDDVIIIPNNYHFDYYERGVTNRDLDTYTNKNMYYYTGVLKVNENLGTVKEIVLDPMWSNIKSINTKLSDTFVYPAGINGFIEQISPRYYGFGIKSKLSKHLYPYLYKEFSSVTFPFITSGAPVVISKSEDPNLFLDLCYTKVGDDGYYGTSILKIQKIKLAIEIENGMNYTITGVIPAIDDIDSNIISVELEPFKDSNIAFQ